MVETSEFHDWLIKNTNYSKRVTSDFVSRIKRADSILEWDGTETYLFYLERKPQFRELTCSVRSQVRKSVMLYSEYYNAINDITHSSL